MTSAISRDDLEDELFKAGIRSVYVRQHLMRTIELYARRYPPVPAQEAPPSIDFGDMHGYKYKCKECGKRKYLGEFPYYKKMHPRSPVACMECQGKKKP